MSTSFTSTVLSFLHRQCQDTAPVKKADGYPSLAEWRSVGREPGENKAAAEKAYRKGILQKLQGLFAASDLANAEDAEIGVRADDKSTWFETHIRNELPENRYFAALTSSKGFAYFGIFAWAVHAAMGFAVRSLQTKQWWTTYWFLGCILSSALFSFVINVTLWLALARCISGVEQSLKYIKALDVYFVFPGDEALQRVEDLGDVENKEELIAKHRVNFNARGADLFKELIQLKMWGKLRQMLQLNQNVEKVDMELHLVILVFALVCRVGVVVANFYVMQKGENRKFQIVNFVVVWDLILILFVLFKCIFICKDVNDSFNNHTVNLARLARHVSLETNKLPKYKTLEEKKKEEEDLRRQSQVAQAGSVAKEEHFGKWMEGSKDATVDHIEAFMLMVIARDSPMRMFGVVINRYTLAAAFAAAGTLVVPCAMPMLMALYQKAEVS